MKIVNRVRVAFLCILTAAHVLEIGLFMNEDLNLLVVEYFVTAVCIYVSVPFVINWLVLRDIKAINRFVDRVRHDDIGHVLPVHDEAMDATDNDEINELRRSLNWMARQIQMRDVRIRRELDRVEMLNQELRHKSITDKLTGLYNYSYFWEQIGNSFSHFQRQTRPFCFAIIDIDFFKKINDTYGHPAGDAVLRGVARILKDEVRDTDIPARIGGEEFGVILNDMQQDDVQQVLDRLQEAIRNATFAIPDGRTVQITASMGFVAVEENKADSAEEVVKLADDALYWVKRNGRNSIMNWDEMRKTA